MLNKTLLFAYTHSFLRALLCSLLRRPFSPYILTNTVVRVPITRAVQIQVQEKKKSTGIGLFSELCRRTEHSTFFIYE